MTCRREKVKLAEDGDVTAGEVTGHVRVRPGEEAAGFEPQLCQGLDMYSLCLKSLDCGMEVVTVAS